MDMGVATARQAGQCKSCGREVQLWRRLGVLVDTSWERAVAEFEFVMVASPLYHAIAKLSRILGVRASLS